ncbi:unnamed protein product [Adineta ricciae]|uniref:TIR domain-containing protein n=1 Tax=Adineta ricciae TaxID=249248 RepID=A0A814YGQ8_ADIRI|nr:unnamed protein product [Adineta ricciae]
MASNFDLLVTQLPVDANLREITSILKNQNSVLESSFISEFYQSILFLERWTWQLFGKNSHQDFQQSTYFDFFQTLALFNKNLVFHYDTINSVTKATVIIPDTIEWINDIFTQLANIIDENDMYIYIVSMWFDNLSLFLFDNPEHETSPTIVHINRCIAQNYIMTDQYKFYLSQLAQPPVSQTVFTVKQLFYIKTCSLSLSSYLFAKAQDFLYTSSDILQHIGPHYIQIIILHTQTIELWSSSLLTCITHLISFFVSCCWWGGEKGSHIRILFSNEAKAGVYIDALIRIVEHKPFRQYLSSQQSSDHTILLDRTLFSLINISQNQEMIWFLRSKPMLPDVLIELAETSVYDKICLCIFSILAEILSNERLKELKIPDSASSYFFRILEHAWNHPLKKFKQIPIYFILKIYITLSKIDAIQQTTANTNKIPLLIEMCDEYPMIFDILWALSFNHDVQQQLRSNSSFMTKLNHPPKEYDNEQIRKIVQGILWNLETTHKDRATSLTSDEKMFDIMISYSHKDEVICRKIYDELIKTGYRIWIDFDQLHGNVMDAMAQAIERSNAIVICMSEEYRRSNYCRAEAHYAFQRQLKMVPILLKEHYQPDGWLLFLVGQLFYIDFTKYEFAQAIEMLNKELKAPVINDFGLLRICSKEEIESAGSATPLCASTTSSVLIIPKHLHEWNSTHVQDWMIAHDLLQLSRVFANFDGSSLIHMYEFIEKLDPQQVVTMLQDDSVRRTNQNLSLVELSHFRSLMKQQMQSSPPFSSTRKRTKLNLNKWKHKPLVSCQII